MRWPNSSIPVVTPVSDREHCQSDGWLVLCGPADSICSNGVEIRGNRGPWHDVDIVLVQELSGDPGYMRAMLHQDHADE